MRSPRMLEPRLWRSRFVKAAQRPFAPLPGEEIVGRQATNVPNPRRTVGEVTDRLTDGIASLITHDAGRAQACPERSRRVVTVHKVEYIVLLHRHPLAVALS